MGSLDSTDTELIANTYATIEKNLIGMMQNVTVLGMEYMQHFDLAQYSYYQFYNDQQTKMPWAHIPTRDQIKTFEVDETTGLYNGADIVSTIHNVSPADTENMKKHVDAGTILSTYGMYPEEAGAEQKPNHWYYSGAIIKKWQRFYTNQEKFRVMLQEAFGIDDAI
jgi:hypothetical protein